METLFQNCRAVLPGHRVDTVDIAFENGIVTSVTPVERSGRGRLAPAEGGAAAQLDYSGKLVLPGLYNCHGHTAMTLVRGLGGGLPLKRWLEEAIFPVEAKMTPDDVAAGTAWGCLEMLAGGTTFVADMYDFPQRCADEMSRLGFRGRIARVGLSFVTGRLADAVQFTRDFNDAATSDDVLADACLHSEYLTDESYCRGLAEANRDLKRPVNVHVSETKKEHEECLARHGKTPIRYLADCGVFDFGGYAAHCVWCTDDDLRIMAERHVTLVHNPSSNMKLGSGFARIPRALELGVNVALGTDGCASNDNLDLFEELHLASLIHKGLLNDPTAVPAWDVIDMATVNGAKAMGDEKGGAIAAGKRADFCVVDLERIHLTPCYDVPNLIVHSMHGSDVVETWIGGVKRYDRGTFPAADYAAIRARFLAACERLMR